MLNGLCGCLLPFRRKTVAIVTDIMNRSYRLVYRKVREMF